jgi:LacI family transcriptional regulator
MKAKRAITIIHVAEKAGVSVSTASRALTGHPDVNPETRNKVFEASSTLGYRPSLLAQGLVSGKTATIGLLVSDISNPFYPALTRSIESAANSYGYIVVLCNTQDDPERSRKYIDRLIAQGVDGIIHASLGEDEELLCLPRDAGVPVVITNRRPRLLKDMDMVISNNRKGAEAIVSHLLSLGHRHIGHLAGPEYASVSNERIVGYRQALKKGHVSYDPYLVLRGPFTQEYGFNGVKELLTRVPQPTAIFAVNDVVALGALDALFELGIEVPRQMSLVGFDDIEFARLHFIQLTTVRQNLISMGRLAVDQIVDAISNPNDHENKTILLEAKLMIRNTSGAVLSSSQP